LDRARLVQHADAIVLATSESAEDDRLAKFACREGIAVFRGSLEDVAERALHCADECGFDRFARVCGDRPFFDAGIVDALFQMQWEQNLDLATNVVRQTFPAGLTAEVIRTEALRRVLRLTKDISDREHVTRYFYRHRELFHIGELHADPKLRTGVPLVVDTKEDLERARFIASRYEGDIANANVEEVIALAYEWRSYWKRSACDKDRG